MIRPMKTISSTIGNMQRSLICIQRIQDLLDTPNEITNPVDAIILKELKQSIEFKDVYFAYESNHNILNGIDLKIHMGQKVALVGDSGGGKTTISDLIPRFYDVTKGVIEIDGVDIRRYDIDSLHSLIGIVMQDAFLFHDTIYNNIAFPNVQLEKEQVIKAAHIANAHDFIMQLPQQYDTVVGDQGSKLSGGQRQRITIARAILRNPPILILDEATSSLDTHSEKLVEEALFYLMQDRTTLIIAHRLSTIKNADYVYVVRKGRIAEEGTPNDLLSRESLYKQMVHLQQKSLDESG